MIVLYQPKMRMEESEEEYQARLKTQPVRVADLHKRYITQAMKEWIDEYKIAVEYDYSDSKDITVMIYHYIDQTAFKLRFGV